MRDNPAAHKNGQGGSILLVEDNPINQKMAQVMLSRMGHHVDLANNGLEAVSKVKEGLYDLIFMDVQMPEMDGFEATLQIRLLEGKAHHTPIVAMTAHAMAGDAQRCFDAGMDDYLSKPLERDKVKSMVEKWALFKQSPNGPESAQKQDPGHDKNDRQDEADRDQTLDVERSLPRFGDDWAFYTSLLLDFSKSLPEEVANLHTALDNHQFDRISFLAHKLKGVAANFNSYRLTNLAKQLDASGKAQALEDCQQLMNEIDQAAAQIIVRINQINQEERV